MSTIKSSSEDLTLNADGSNDIKFQSNGVEKASISSAGAFTSTTIDATKLTGEKASYIIDGDFTQWEDTSATSFANATYSGAMLMKWGGSTTGTATMERSTDVPTAAESGHQSDYSVLYKCTGTDTPSASENLTTSHIITGSDYANLHGGQYTVSFWAKTAANNSGHRYYVALSNASAGAGSIVNSFIPTSSWQKFSFTVTADTVGTWGFNEASAGLRIYIALMAGTTFDDATEGVWNTTFELYDSTSAIGNFMASTSNEFYLSQLQCVKGSVAPTFSSESVATVKSQVDYYVQRFDYDVTSYIPVTIGGCNATSSMRTTLYFRKEMRGTPTVTSSAASTFAGSDYLATATGSSVATTNEDRHHVELALSQAGTTWTTGMAGMIQRDGTDTCWVMADARH